MHRLFESALYSTDRVSLLIATFPTQTQLLEIEVLREQ